MRWVLQQMHDKSFIIDIICYCSYTRPLLSMGYWQTSYDSVVLTKNTGVIRGLPIDDGPRKEKKLYYICSDH